MANPENLGNTGEREETQEWKKSSFDASGPDFGVLVGRLGLQGVAKDVNDSIARTVLMGDGKHPEGMIHEFTAEEWEAFVLGVKAGEFDFPDEPQPDVQ